MSPRECPMCGYSFGSPETCSMCHGRGLAWVTPGVVTEPKPKKKEAVAPWSTWHMYLMLPYGYEARPSDSHYHGLAVRVWMKSNPYQWMLYWRGAKVVGGKGDLPAVSQAMKLVTNRRMK